MKKKVPGKFQLLLETLVGFFDKLAKSNSPYHNTFLGSYIFTAGLFIFFGTLIELFGFRSVMGDLNACVVMGFMSYGVILAGGLGPENVAEAIKAVHPDGVDSLTKTSVVKDGVILHKDIERVREFCRIAKETV